MKLILDAMSGDLGSAPAVEAAVRAVQELGLEVTLVGREAEIREKLTGRNAGITVVNASEVVDMHDAPTTVIRQKKDSSMVVALNLLAAGEGDALVSCGNTGALLTGATLLVKRIKGVRRACLAAMMPTGAGHSLLLDCGANAECTTEYLTQFAYMGYHYYRTEKGVDRPTVGLLNNGAEESKGTDLQKETYAVLKADADAGKINFIGNVEGRDIAQGAANVLVVDGFTGNLVLKTYEGVGLYLVSQMKAMFKKGPFTMLAALLVKSGLMDLKKRMDYKEVGGAPLLGISKPVIKAHGGSDEIALFGAIRQAVRYTEGGVVEAIAASLRAEV